MNVLEFLVYGISWLWVFGGAFFIMYIFNKGLKNIENKYNILLDEDKKEKKQ
jgi:hypothetical protein